MNTNDEQRAYPPRYADESPPYDRYEQPRPRAYPPTPQQQPAPMLPASFFVRIMVAGVIITLISEVLDKFFH